MAEKSTEEILEEQKANCPFCKIIAGEFPSKKVYEDEKLFAVLDINPAVKGHTLMLPKQHYPLLAIIPEDLFAYMFEKSVDVSKAIEESMLVQGMEWFIASGGAAGQQVPHFILHLIPREEGDGLENFNLKEGAVSDEQVKEFMPKIKDRLLVALGKKKPEKLTKEKLFEIIEKSPKLKETMVEKPEEFKKMVEATPQLKQMFADFNIDEIIAELKAGKKEGEEEKKEDKGNGKADLDKITDVLNKDGM